MGYSPVCKWDRLTHLGRFGLVMTALALLTATSSSAQAPAPDSPRITPDLFPIVAQDQPPPDQQAADSTGDQGIKPLKVNPVTNLATSSATNFVPLTRHDRWKLYWRQTYSVGAYFGPVLTATVLDQTMDSPPQWGPGIGGYGLRVASRIASGMVQETVQAPLAAVLHEDVRYIASPRHDFSHRTLHAIEYSVVTYNGRGRPTPDIANLTALYASTAVSGAWLPDNTSLARYTFTNGTEQIGLSVAVNILQEFWPDIRRSIFHRHSP